MKPGSVENAPQRCFTVIQEHYKTPVNLDPASDPLEVRSDENPHPCVSFQTQRSFETASDNQSSRFEPVVVDLTESSDEETEYCQFNLAANSDGLFNELDRQIASLANDNAADTSGNHLHCNLTPYVLQDITYEGPAETFTPEDHEELAKPNVNYLPKDVNGMSIEGSEYKFEENVFDAKSQITEITYKEECDENVTNASNHSPKYLRSKDMRMEESNVVLLFNCESLKIEVEDCLFITPEITEQFGTESIDFASAEVGQKSDIVEDVTSLNNSSAIKHATKPARPVYKSHIMRRFDPYSNMCKTCKRMFSSEFSFIRHYEAVHLGMRPFGCDICGKSFTTKHHMQMHEISAHTRQLEFSCSLCPKSFATQGKLKAHHSGIHSGIRPYKCEICFKTFSTKWKLKTHSGIHSEIRPFNCETCSKSFSFKSILKTHSWIHSGNFPFKCEICAKTFSTKWNLKTHTGIHSGISPFKCEICSKTFSTKQALKSHSGIHSEILPYKCEICFKTFSTKWKLKTHSVIHSGISPFKCETCSKTFSTKQSLISHSVIHSGISPFKCEICFKYFASKSSLKTHSGIRPFKCETCSKTFSTKQSLISHTGLHSEIQRFKCKICSERFSTKSNLKLHAKSHPPRNKLSHCEFCGKSYATKGSLNTHYLTHSSIKRFECQVCGNKFATAWSLKIHRRNIHLEAVK